VEDGVPRKMRAVQPLCSAWVESGASRRRGVRHGLKVELLAAERGEAGHAGEACPASVCATWTEKGREWKGDGGEEPRKSRKIHTIRRRKSISSRFCALLSPARAQRQRPPQSTKGLRSALGSRNPLPFPTLSLSYGHTLPRASRSARPAGSRHGPQRPDPRRGRGPPGGGGARCPRRARRGLDRRGGPALGHPARRRRADPRRDRVGRGERAERPAPEGPARQGALRVRRDALSLARAGPLSRADASGGLLPGGPRASALWMSPVCAVASGRGGGAGVRERSCRRGLLGVLLGPTRTRGRARLYSQQSRNKRAQQSRWTLIKNRVWPPRACAIVAVKESLAILVIPYNEQSRKCAVAKAYLK
jgi:hypothetical protein